MAIQPETHTETHADTPTVQVVRSRTVQLVAARLSSGANGPRSTDGHEVELVADTDGHPAMALLVSRIGHRIVVDDGGTTVPATGDMTEMTTHLYVREPEPVDGAWLYTWQERHEPWDSGLRWRPPAADGEVPPGAPGHLEPEEWDEDDPPGPADDVHPAP